MHNDESSLADTPDDAQRADSAPPGCSWWPLTEPPCHEPAAWLLTETDRGRSFETRPFCLEHAQIKLEGAPGVLAVLGVGRVGQLDTGLSEAVHGQ